MQNLGIVFSLKVPVLELSQNIEFERGDDRFCVNKRKFARARKHLF